MVCGVRGGVASVASAGGVAATVDGTVDAGRAGGAGGVDVGQPAGA